MCTHLPIPLGAAHSFVGMEKNSRGAATRYIVTTASLTMTIAARYVELPRNDEKSRAFLV